MKTCLSIRVLLDKILPQELELATRSPDRMYDRALLKIQAEEEARKTFVFKKKSGSRSKYNTSESNQQSEKRKKLSSDERAKEIRMCSIELQNLTAECANKEKQIRQANDVKDYERCATMHKELRDLWQEKKKVNNKLTELQKKEARHLKYLSSGKRTPLNAGDEVGEITKASSCTKDITSFFKSSLVSQSSTKSETDSVFLESSDEDDNQTSSKRKKLDVDGANKLQENDHEKEFVVESLSEQSITRSEKDPAVLAIEIDDEDHEKISPEKKILNDDGPHENDEINENDNVKVLKDGQLESMEPLHVSDCKVEEAVVKYCEGMQETENKEKQAEKSESIGRHQGEQVEDEDTVRGIQDKNHFL